MTPSQGMEAMQQMGMGMGGGRPGTGQRLGTGMMRRPQSRGSGVGLGPGTTSHGMLNTDVQLSDRPVTQQGMMGLRGGPAGPGRQIQDKSFYLAQLRRKLQELSQVNGEMDDAIQAHEKEQVQLQKLGRKEEELARSLKALQGELADHNIMLDKIGTDSSLESIERDARELKQKNDLERKRVDALFMEKANMEQRCRDGDLEIDRFYMSIEQRINELPPERRRQYYDLKSETADLRGEVQRTEEELSALKRNEHQALATIHLDSTKLKAVELYEQIAELEEKKYNLEAQEAKLGGDPNVTKQQLMAQIKAENTTVAQLEKDIKAMNAEIRRMEKRAAAAGPAEPQESSPADVQAEMQQAAGRERDMEQFIADFPQILAEARGRLEHERAEVLRHLEDASYAMSAQGYIPSKKEFKVMKDELKYTQQTVQNSQRTNEQLQSELDERQKELEKVKGLESKIDDEIQALQKKEAKVRREIEKFGNLGVLEAEAEQEKRKFQAMRESFSGRRELTEKTVHEKQRRHDTKRAQLEENASHREHERLEMQLRKKEQARFALAEKLADKEAETNFKPLLGKVFELVEELNARHKRTAMLT